MYIRKTYLASVAMQSPKPVSLRFELKYLQRLEASGDFHRIELVYVHGSPWSYSDFECKES